MKNLFKKLLASCLVVCMVLTLCVGAITVNAENPTGTVVAGEVTVDSGEGTAVVPVEVSAGVAASKVSVKVPANLTITALTLDTADEDVDVTYASAAEPNGKPISLVEATEFVAPYVDAEGVFSYIIHAPAGEVTTAPVIVKISFTGTFVENAEGILVDVEAQAAPDAVVLFDLTVTDGKIIVKAAHVCAAARTEQENVNQATCYAEGSYDEVVYCSCGKELSRTPKTIDKIAHTPAEAVVENNKAATCYAEGSYDSVVYCSVEACKFEISRTPVTVEKTEHTPAEAVVENNKAATCLAAGSYESVVYCSVAECKHEISRTTIPTAKLDHVFGDNLEFCANNCGTANPDYVAPVVCEHEWDVTASTPAVKIGTEVTPGSISVECKKCGEKSLNNTVGYNAKAGIYNMEAVVKSEVMLQLATKFSGFPAGFVAEDVILVAYTNNTKNGTPDKDCILGTTTRSDGTYEYFDLGVAAYQLSENINITIYVKAADGWVNGKTQNIAFTTYAKTILDTSNDAGVKRVVVDLLNFGSAVQTLNNYNLESLANEEFDSYQSLGSDTSSSPVAESDVNFHQDKSQPMRLASYELIADSRIEFRISLFVKPAVESGAVYVANYTDSNGVEYNVAYVSDESAVETLSGIDFDKVYVLKPYDANATYNKYYVNFAELPVYDSEANVTFTAYANGVAGETLSCSVKGAAAYTRSLKTDDSKSVAAFDALIRYCDSAIAKFR